MRLLSTLLALGLTFSFVNAAAFEQEIHSASATVKVSSEKPLVVGNNAVVLEINKDAKPSSGDEVTIKTFMPAMPGMPYMENKEAAKELSPGKYETIINFSMSGTWQIHIYVTPKEGKKYRVKTSVNI
ncbi:FixH family protein [bacterium]|nr:FixH family protein [bacterium]MBU1434264.1 FixH family protein [bacterium]MBU1503655.1 FixH family protein [bacterium]